MYIETKILLWVIIQKISADTIVVQFESGEENTFANVQKVGEGGNGVIYKGEWTEADGKVVALKIANSDEGDAEILIEVNCYKHFGVLNGNTESESFKRAVAAGICEAYNFGTVVNFLLETDGSDKSQICLIGKNVLIMELVGLNLFKATTVEDSESRVNLSPTEWFEVGLQMLRAIQFLHSMGIIHGDIKPENFALRKGKALCILDFGSARMITEKFGEIKGSAYFHSALITNKFLQLYNWLPEDILPLEQDPGVNDDLESLMITFYDIQVPVDWENYENTFTFYHEISDPNYNKQEGEMDDDELEAINLTQMQRNDIMTDALVKMLKLKQEFPDQVQTNIAQVLQKTPDLENIQNVIDLLREIIFYARTNLPETQSESKEKNVRMEGDFVRRWTVILENWNNTHPVQTSMLNSKTFASY